MLLLIAVHFGLAALTPLLGRWLRQRAFLVLALPPAATVCWLITQLEVIIRGDAVTEQVSWIPTLAIGLSFSMSALQWLLALVVSGIGVLVLLYCRWYFSAAMPNRTAAVLLAFAGAMLGLVTADDLIMVYVFWELTTIFSYLLIGHNPVNSANRRAAMTALIVTTVGGLAMLVGILIVGEAAGSYQLSEVLAMADAGTGLTGPAVSVAVVLILVGAVSKSALVPFHFWLPGAMAAPTPISAYLHAAAMVKAGVYLVAVLAPAFADAGVWRPVLLVLGPATMLLGGWRALRQHDIKLLLAYGTVSQLGFMITIAGIGNRSAALAGCALLLGHALFKSALFMIVGVVDHQAGTRDLRRLSGVGRQLPGPAITAVVAAASMAGLPPLFGFVAKESALGALVAMVGDGDGTGLPAGVAIAILTALVIGSALTVAYTLRFLWGTFATKTASVGRPEVTRCTPPALGFWLLPAIPAATGLVLGVLTAPVNRLLEPYASSLGAGHHGELVLWHGFTPQLGLSLLAIAAGVALFAARDRFAAFQAGLPRPVAAESVYATLMRAVDRVSVEVTARVQRGSLPFYLGTIALAVVIFPGAMLIFGPWQRGVRPYDHPAQPVVAALIIVAAVLAARSRGRMKAILLVGVTGYGTAFLFLLHGAPDLALTQVLVETVTLIVLTLVLRRLGPYFSDRPLLRSRWWRLVLAGGVGAVAALAAIMALGHREATPVSADFPQHAYEFGYGKNIVNVTLVDTRAWDTLGEISVLMVAATGVASLVFLVTRNPTVVRTTPSATRMTWLRGANSLSPLSRSIVLVVMIRLLFPIIVLCSLFLLFTGHNSPGGGFAAGLITGLALILRYLGGGVDELTEAAPIDAGRVLGAGLLLSVLSAIAPITFGGRILESYAIDIDLGPLSRLQTPWGGAEILGEIHLVTSLFFDLGVYLVVVGVLLDLVRSLGAGIDTLPRDQVREPAIAERSPA